MSKIGHDITQKELDEIMRQHDLEDDGVISYMEFKALFLDLKDVT
jgi:Ca2+-binding EF-hand superfamily protein